MYTITQMFVNNGENYNQLSQECAQILPNLQNTLIVKFDRKNIDVDDGVWCFTKDTPLTLFTKVDKSYTDRLAYKLLKELKRCYDDFNDH